MITNYNNYIKENNSINYLEYLELEIYKIYSKYVNEFIYINSYYSNNKIHYQLKHKKELNNFTIWEIEVISKNKLERINVNTYSNLNDRYIITYLYNDVKQDELKDTLKLDLNNLESDLDYYLDNIYNEFMYLLQDNNIFNLDIPVIDIDKFLDFLYFIIIKRNSLKLYDDKATLINYIKYLLDNKLFIKYKEKIEDKFRSIITASNFDLI